jgi:uncharacterized membrane protein YgcG
MDELIESLARLNIIELVLGAGVIMVVINLLFSRRRVLALQREGEKSEALFKTMFPELQPHLHPTNVIEYVREHVKRGKKVASPWENPPGFPFAKRAILEQTPKGERTILQDAAGATLAEFLFEWGDKAPTIGMVRVGKGKFRVKHRSPKPPYASYWHPDREFDWKPPRQWTFRSHVADDSISSSDHGTNWSSSSSSSSTAAGAAAAAGIVAAGGTFDGGGASAGWDGGGGSSSSGDTSSSTSTGY